MSRALWLSTKAAVALGEPEGLVSAVVDVELLLRNHVKLQLNTHSHDWQRHSPGGYGNNNRYKVTAGICIVYPLCYL